MRINWFKVNSTPMSYYTKLILSSKNNRIIFNKFKIYVKCGLFCKDCGCYFTECKCEEEINFSKNIINEIIKNFVLKIFSKEIIENFFYDVELK